MMHREDADLFERIVLKQLGRARGTFAVLEWGSGRSTLYFSRLLQALGKPFRWLALEYDRSFYETAIEPNVPANLSVKVVCVEREGSRQRQTVRGEAPYALELAVFDHGPLSPFSDKHSTDRQIDMDDYVDYPRRLGRQFDLILVDGRKRRRCLIEASHLMKPGGVTLLHDAHREYYACAFEEFYVQSRIGTILWTGSQSARDFSELLTSTP